MQLFLDTNVYLDYFIVSNDELKPLRRLTELVKSGDVTLLLPEQVRQEYERNRDKIAERTREHLVKISEQQISPAMPLMMGSKREVKMAQAAIKRAQIEVRDAIQKLLQKFDEQVEQETSAADKLIATLFKKARLIKETDETIAKAEHRFLKGNPPRKSDRSYGDAIVWEALLANAAPEPLTLITRDSDYTEKRKGKKVVKSFLFKEWRLKSSHKLNFFDSLGEFINHFDKKETVKKEVVEKEKEKASSYVDANTWARLASDNFNLPTTAAANNISSFRLPLPVAGFGSTIYTADSAIGIGGIDGIGYASFGRPNVSYCPHCGKKDPLPDTSSYYQAWGMRRDVCKYCNKTIIAQ